MNNYGKLASDMNRPAMDAQMSAPAIQPMLSALAETVARHISGAEDALGRAWSAVCRLTPPSPADPAVLPDASSDGTLAGALAIIEMRATRLRMSLNDLADHLDRSV